VEQDSGDQRGRGDDPLLPKLLHFFLGLDVHEFYQEVQPTWKLGIRFEWEKPGSSYVNFPFDLGLLLESLL
jgi:tryptophan halogenase